MSKKWVIAIAVFVVVGVVACTGLGALRWGEMIYRRSDGQRGWSLGAGIYRMLGWDAQAYEEDFGQAHWFDHDDEDETADCVELETPFGHHRGLRPGRRFGHSGAPRFLAGLGCLVFLGLLVVPGALLYRRWRKDKAAAALEPDQ
jgi:hypothetical protein